MHVYSSCDGATRTYCPSIEGVPSDRSKEIISQHRAVKAALMKTNGDKAGLIVQPATQHLRAASTQVQGGHQEREYRSLNAGRAGAGRKIEYGQMRNLRNQAVAEKDDNRRPRAG